MKKRYCILLTSVVLLLFGFVVHAQRSTSVGMNFTIETYGNHFRPGLGATIEHRFTKKRGIESGLYYRNYTANEIYTIYNGTQFVSHAAIVAQKFISVPFLYKFYSKLINVSAGLTFDFYVGYRHKNKSDQFAITGYSIDPNMGIGVQVKLSKPIRIDENLFLEPELRFNPVITYLRTYGGLGITAKYRLK